MRDISEAGKWAEEFRQHLRREVKKAVENTTETLIEDVKSRVVLPSIEETRNPAQFNYYVDSIESDVEDLSEVEYQGKVFSELKVGGDNPKWVDVPLGAFVEWGTGTFGEGTNTYPHGYPYTTEAPWDRHSAHQFKMFGAWGITAKPHFIPAFLAIQPTFEDNLRKAVEEAWKKSIE